MVGGGIGVHSKARGLVGWEGVFLSSWGSPLVLESYLDGSFSLSQVQF